MLKKIIILSLLGFCWLISANNGFGQKIVTSAQVNGTWRDVTDNSKGITSEFRIWSIGPQKLQVQFFGNNSYREVSNTATGTIMIQGTTANFKPADNQIDEKQPCLITLKFVGPKLIVSEKGACGWGRGIGAAGTYKKINSAKPDFEEQ